MNEVFPSIDVPVSCWRPYLEAVNIDDGTASSPRPSVGSDVKCGVSRCEKQTDLFLGIICLIDKFLFILQRKIVKSCQEEMQVGYTSSDFVRAAAVSTRLLSSYTRIR